MQAETPGKACVLDRIRTFLRRFVVLTDSQAVELSLWVAHTHAFEASIATPYQNIHSAEKESGKTRLLEVLELLVATPWLTGRVSAAALVREIDSVHPTLLLDESDAAFGRDKEYAEALREVLNMGHRRGGKATICVGQGVNTTTKRFDVFCPKAIAGIGRLPDTVAGRSVPIRLKRKTANEQVERFRQRLVEREASELRQLVAAWAKANVEQLRSDWPGLPEVLSDRQQDGAEPLLAIADLAGEPWPQRAREALVELFTGAEAQDDSIRTRLLADIRTVFDLEGSDRLSTTRLLGALSKIETSPWAEFKDGRPISPTTLARLLKPFDITPRDIRIGSKTLKGYERECFEDAWTRYTLPPAPTLPEKGQQGQQASACAVPNLFREGQHQPRVAPQQNAKTRANTRVVADVAPLKADNANGHRTCSIHPENKANWWLRGDDPVCGQCHPNPSRSR